MRKAVVLGTELPRATAIIQSLGRRGVPIVAMDHRLGMPGSRSRYIAKDMLEEHDRTGRTEKSGSDSKWHFSTQQALDRLYASDLDGSVLVPSNDDYLMLVSRNHNDLAEKYVLTTPPWEIVRNVMDKERVYSMAANAGIEVPAFFNPGGLEDAKAIIADLSFNERSYIFKLHPWAPGSADPVSGAMTRPAGSSAQEAVDNYQDIFDRTGQLAMIQEVVPGNASVCIGVALLAGRDQQVIAAYSMQRTRTHTYSSGGQQVHPYELGANLTARSVEDSEAISLAGKLVEASGMYGVLTVEFRRSLYDGRLKLIKVDPRHVNAAALGRSVGVDMPWLEYRYFCGMPVAGQFKYATGKQWVWPDRWLRLFMKDKRRVSDKLWEMLGLVVRARSIGYFSVRDWRPFLRAMDLEWSRAKKDAAAGERGRGWR